MYIFEKNQITIILAYDFSSLEHSKSNTQLIRVNILKVAFICADTKFLSSKEILFDMVFYSFVSCAHGSK